MWPIKPRLAILLLRYPEVSLSCDTPPSPAFDCDRVSFGGGIAMTSDT